jgi:transaldolase
MRPAKAAQEQPAPSKKEKLRRVRWWIVIRADLKQQQEIKRLMKFFADTADIADIRDLADLGLLDGVTTNPSLIAKSGRDFIEVVQEICAIVPGPVSAEVTALDTETMLKEGRKLAALAKNIAVKVPLTWDGLKACKALSGDGIMVNVTLCFSANQALLAAKAGASFISPFIGRLDDIHLNGMELVQEIRTIYDNYDFATEILAASIRSANHVKEAALVGADIVTVPPAVLRGLASHPLTDKGLQQFLADWKKTGQKIL